MLYDSNITVFFFCLFVLTFQFLLSSLLYCCMCKCYLHHNHWISGIDSDTWKWVGSWKNSLVCRLFGFWVITRKELSLISRPGWVEIVTNDQTTTATPPKPTCLQMKHIVLRSNLVMSFTWVLYKGELFLSFACGW